MKKILKNIGNFLKGFLKAYFKLNKIENSISINLEKAYFNYQKEPTEEKLYLLKNNAEFCQRNFINGRTTKIQNIIIDLWEKTTINKPIK